MELKDYLVKHIGLLEAEKKKIEEKLKTANSLKWDLIDYKKTFNCKKGLSNKDAICIDCEIACPKFDKDNRRFIFPDGERLNNFSKADSEKRICSEWEKKNISTACGCGGTNSCICGYTENFCMQTDGWKCPFCGRECATEFALSYGELGNVFIDAFTGK